MLLTRSLTRFVAETPCLGCKRGEKKIWVSSDLSKLEDW